MKRHSAMNGHSKNSYGGVTAMNRHSKSSHSSITDSKTATADVAKPASKQRLLFYHEIPSWQQGKGNDYILSGYRPIAGSTLECILGSLSWHNETINIISHLFGSILFAALPWHFYTYIYTSTLNAVPIDMLLFTAYFLGVSVCFACSVSCHVTINHSPVVAFFALRLDFLGIVLLMWTASLPSIYYGFICNPHLQLFHWTLISILAVSCIVATLHPRFGASQFRSYRTALYAGLGLSAAIFVCHGIALHGYDAQERRMALRWMGVMALLNLAGAAAYAVRCPERWFPYRFDFVGASHQIFHVLVVLAGLAHYAGLVQALREVRVTGQHCGPVV